MTQILTLSHGGVRWRKIKSDEERAAAIVTTIGLPAMRIYEALPFAGESEKADSKKLMDYLEEHFVGTTNANLERYVFNSLIQKDGESFSYHLAIPKTTSKLRALCV